MRPISLLLLVLLAACQSSKTETYSDEVKCDARAADMGLCDRGKYDD